MPKLLNRSEITRLARDLLVLSVRITWSMLVAGLKLIYPRYEKSLLGEVVLITGAGHGIGRELALLFGSLGSIVICWDKNADANRETVSLVTDNGGEVYGFAVDVSDRASVKEAMLLMRRSGMPDVGILVNNAAVLYHRPFLEQSQADVERTFAVNVLSNFWTIEAFLPRMLENEHGHIVAICSMCGMYGVPHKVAYCSSKFAVRGLMEGLHEELRLTGRSSIRFTTIYPFYVDTGLARDPKYRFPYIFGCLSAEYAASEIVKAIRRNYTEYAVPRCLLTLNAVNRIVPDTVMRLILDFLGDVERNWPSIKNGGVSEVS